MAKKMEESFYLSQDQTQKKRYVGTKSDHWGLRYGPAKFVRMSYLVPRTWAPRTRI